MKLLSVLALAAIICVPSISHAAGCGTCAPEPTCGACPPPAPSCAPCAPVCYQPVVQSCICCPKIRGFWG